VRVDTGGVARVARLLYLGLPLDRVAVHVAQGSRPWGGSETTQSIAPAFTSNKFEGCSSTECVGSSMLKPEVRREVSGSSQMGPFTVMMEGSGTR
jgi:hypothetical protein